MAAGPVPLPQCHQHPHRRRRATRARCRSAQVLAAAGRRRGRRRARGRGHLEPVTVTGRYDPAHEILARVRTLHDNVGFEVITPLVLADGTAVLVDRGWIPAAAA